MKLSLKIVYDALVERLLELDGSAGIQRDLDEIDIVAVVVAEIIVGDIQIVAIVLRDDLELSLWAR